MSAEVNNSSKVFYCTASGYKHTQCQNEHGLKKIRNPKLNNFAITEGFFKKFAQKFTGAKKLGQVREWFQVMAGTCLKRSDYVNDK